MRLIGYRPLIFCAVLALALTAGADELSQDDINYQAEFIVNIVDDVTWPAGSGTDSQDAVVIAVVGSSPVTPRLKQLAAEKSGAGKPMKVTEVSPEDNLAACQILFIASDDKAVLAGILKKVDGRPVLTVSDAEYFANCGVMVNFIHGQAGGDKSKFEVNRMTLDLAHLKMSPKLLKLAKLI